MSNPDPAAPESAPAGGVPQPDAAAPEPEPVVVQSEVEVELRRSVRWGRLLVVGAIVGVVVGVLASLSFPVEEGADYTMRQIAGFMAIIGGAIGLGLGGLLALILNQAAKRRRGRGVAIQTDVR